MNIAETYFIANKATGGDGGAICNYEGELTIAGSHFINNTASFNGGAIRIGGKSTVTNCNFTNNTVNKYYGGAKNDRDV